MPPMSRPFTTACAIVTAICLEKGSSLCQRSACVFLGKNRRKIAMLPLHPDRMRVDVLAVRAELDLPAGTHRRIAGGNIEGCERVTHFLRVSRGRALQCISDHERLCDEPAR